MQSPRSSSRSTEPTRPRRRPHQVRYPVRWPEPAYWWNCWRKSEERCGKRLHRPHLTCFTCWLRRMHSGLMPTNLRCGEIRILLWMYRPGYRWKRPILKVMLSVVEALTR